MSKTYRFGQDGKGSVRRSRDTQESRKRKGKFIPSREDLDLQDEDNTDYGDPSYFDSLDFDSEAA
jgi:hypothetical protein